MAFTADNAQGSMQAGIFNGEHPDPGQHLHGQVLPKVIEPQGRDHGDAGIPLHHGAQNLIFIADEREGLINALLPELVIDILRGIRIVEDDPLTAQFF